METNNDANTPAPQDNNSRTKLITTIAVLLVAVLLVVGIKAFSNKSDSGAKPDSVTTTSSNSSANKSTDNAGGSSADSGSSSSSATSSNSAYKDGTYSATGTYATPESQEKINVTVTLKEGKITEASATTDPQARESREWQERFLSGYKQQVIGKSISDLKLSRVSGSSLTPNGFNNAIDAIKDQAKS